MVQKDKSMITRFLFISVLLLTSCGEIDCEQDPETGQWQCNNGTPTPTPTVIPTSTPTRTATPSVSPTRSPTPTVSVTRTPQPTNNPPSGMNPFCASTPQDSRNHLLWKPVSDTSGNAVVVTDGKYKKEFLTVKAELKNGTFETLFYKPLVLFGNPDKDGPRQHWRSKNKAGAFKEKALIIADDGFQTCTWQLPGSPLRRWE